MVLDRSVVWSACSLDWRSSLRAAGFQFCCVADPRVAGRRMPLASWTLVFLVLRLSNGASSLSMLFIHSPKLSLLTILDRFPRTPITD